MTSAGKRELKTAHKLASHEHPKGTDFRLRQNTGINFDKNLTMNCEEKSELKKQIERFAEENSSESPDMRNEKRESDTGTNIFSAFTMISSMIIQILKSPCLYFAPTGLRILLDLKLETMHSAPVKNVKIQL